MEIAVGGQKKEEKRVAGFLQAALGKNPVVEAGMNLMCVSLKNVNSMWHPVIVYGAFRKWDGKTSFGEKPLFYEGVDEFTADKITKCSDEMMEIKKVLESKGVGLSKLTHLNVWLQEAYPGQIEDETNLKTSINTNKSYKGMAHSMTLQADGKTYLPNFKARYLTEDVPYGFLYNKGVAELCGVETPNMDEVIAWNQSKMGKEYIAKNGRLQLSALEGTRAPQAFGLKTLSSFLAAYDDGGRDEAGQPKVVTSG